MRKPPPTSLRSIVDSTACQPSSSRTARYWLNRHRLNWQPSLAKIMHNQELFDLLIAEVNPPFSGWNFSYITATGRMVEAPLTWSYTSKLLPMLRKAQSLLDMGTGGGEF